ncbi:hypothetical protein NDN01_18510 [Sphingomonas sp. QA11]|nr:hypothetical protein [Sphingomonas sp. QA11]WCM30036.1 hypothetical protein NDN01_18510 [Sphingomonas sp. QA11]
MAIPTSTAITPTDCKTDSRSPRKVRPSQAVTAAARVLKQLVADLSLDKHILQDVLSKKL